MNYLTFNGKSTLDFGVGISGESSFNAPTRDVDFVSIAGRNGDLTIDNGRYNNIEVTYPAFISRNFKSNVVGLRAFLCSQKGYQRLEDTYSPDYYRKGVFLNGLEFETLPLNVAANFELVFNCKPQRFLKSGEQSYTFEDGGTIYNPTRFNSKPIIRVYGTGTLTIGDYSITIDSLLTEPYIDLDCDLMNAYKGSLNLNNYVSGDFPELVPGANEITYDGTIELVPNWWTL